MSAAEKLIDETQTTDLITVDAHPALLRCNFEEVKARLSTELQKYDVVVTQDTLADAKKLATELNKNASEFDRRRKEAVATVSEPIRHFEGQMKELVLMCKEGRQKILSQVQRYEDETRAAVLSLLVSERAEQWDRAGVESEHRSAEIDDLVKLTGITKSGNKLTAATLSEVERRVSADLQRQDKVKMRLVMLENQSFKAGLSAPLTRDHINSFLYAPDDEYQSHLDRIIESELRRQEQAEAAMRARLEREQEDKRRQEEADRQAAARQAEQHQAEAPEPESLPEPPPYDPEPQPAPIQHATQSVGERYAYGLLSNPSAARVVRCSRPHAEQLASVQDDAEPCGVWTPDGLISITYRGEVFRKD